MNVLPFFEEMKGGYSGRAIYVKHTSSNMYDAIVETPKYYLYLLKPFNNQYLVYGQTLDYFKKTKSEKKGITEPKPKLGSDSFTFIKTVDELRKEEIRLIKLDEEYPGLEALATYRFINLIRLCSQLTINPSHFYPDYDKRITKILDEWEQDAPAGFQQKLQDGESFTGEIKRSLWETKKLKRIKKRVNLPGQNHTNNLMPFLPISSRPAPKELVDKFIDMTVEILQKLQNNGNELDEDQMLIERATVHYLCGSRIRCFLNILKGFRVVRKKHNTGAFAAPASAAGDDPLHPLLRKLLDASKQLVSRCCLERMATFPVIVLLARPPLAANPDAKHPGKARE